MEMSDDPPMDSIFMFAICQGILLYCAGYTVYQTVPHTAAGWRDVSTLFKNKTFLDLALSLMVSLADFNGRPHTCGC